MKYLRMDTLWAQCRSEEKATMAEATMDDEHEEPSAVAAHAEAGRIPADMAGIRLDRALAALFPAYSRARLQQWLREGMILVDGERPRARETVRGGEVVELCAPQTEKTSWRPEEVDFRIVYEDDALIVVDKPAGLTVHPGAGNPGGTLVNGLLHHAPELVHLPRAGIVHRLDKDTSGLLVVARTLEAHKSLVEQLQARTMGREYEAVAYGVLTAGGTVSEPIGRHPTARTRMAVSERGKPAVTHYRVVERYAGHTWIRVRLETGRTHQIRVHMAHLRHPLVGDPDYGGRLRLPAGCFPALRDVLRAFPRQALHAARLTLQHPAEGAPCEWTVSIPADMAALIEALREDRDARGPQ